MPLVKRILLSTTLCVGQVAPAFATPSGGAVQSGDISISQPTGSSLSITQTSDRGLIHWQDFSIDTGEVVRFIQPNANSITANRVIGVNASELYGRIEATGQVILINPNGIIFGADSVIDAAGLVASTLAMNEEDFQNGANNVRFEIQPGQPGYILNAGTQLISDGGLAILLSPEIRHSGHIQARLGQVSLAATEAATIDLFGDGLIEFAPEGAVTSSDADALITQSGSIEAQGGLVTLSAQAASDVIVNSINLSGRIIANRVTEEDGVITLAGTHTVQIDDQAVLDASGLGATDTGGTIVIDGGAVSQGGILRANGATGGSISLTSAELLNLGGQESAAGTSSDVYSIGGTIRYSAGRILANSSHIANASGAGAGGSIRMTADNLLAISGTYNASGSLGSGGQIDMSAADMRLLSAQIDASGTSQGGLVRIGGAFQGGKTTDFSQDYIDDFLTRWGTVEALQSARRNHISSGSNILVSSEQGQGGTAVIWSEDQTTFLGSISATGQYGAAGTGGAVELSSAALLRQANLNDISVGDGTLLLDPKNITIGQSTIVRSWSYAGVLGIWDNNATEPSALATGDMMGTSVAIDNDNDRLAIGVVGDDGQGNSGTDFGAVYLYSFSDSDYGGASLGGIIGSGYTGGNNINNTALSNNDGFGFSVAFDSDGDRLAVGAMSDDGASDGTGNSGAVYLYSFTDTSFSGGSLSGTMGAGYTGGNNVNVTLDSSDGFGYAITLSDDATRLAVGMPQADGSGNNLKDSGEVRLFSFTDGDFSGGTQQGIFGNNYTSSGSSLGISGLAISDSFGSAVAFNDDATLLAVGAMGDDADSDGMTNSGAVYMFTFSDGDFSSPTQIGMIGSGYKNASDVEMNNAQAGEQFGRSVSLNGDGNRLVVGAAANNGMNNTMTDAGAVHLFTFANTSFGSGSQVGSIGANYTGGNQLNETLDDNDNFGTSVALNDTGDRLIVGAPMDDGLNNGAGNSGAIYLYSFSNNSFGNASRDALFGKDYVISPFDDVTGLAAGETLGMSVSFNDAGTRLAIGASNDSGSTSSTNQYGAVYLYSFSDSNYSGATLEGVIGQGYTGSKNVNVTLADDDAFGASVSLDGDANRLAVGATGDDGSDNSVTNSGAVYLFSFSDTSFSSGALTATIGSGYTSGSKDVDLSSLDTADRLGAGVSLSDSAQLLAIGAPGDAGSSDTLSGSGAVHLLRFDDSNFTNGTVSGTIGRGYTSGGNFDLTALDASDAFGTSVALDADGTLLAVGAPEDDNSADSGDNEGAVYLFTFGDNSFVSPSLSATVGSGYSGGNNVSIKTLGTKDGFGSAVSLDADGDMLAIGTPGDDGRANGISEAGAVYLLGFTDLSFSGGTLQQLFGSDYTGDSITTISLLGGSDAFGQSVSLSGAGDLLAVGASQDDGINNATSNAGSVYLFNSSRSGGGYTASNQQFATTSSDAITVNAYDIADQLARGTDMVLQASNDISVSSAITVPSYATSPGDLTLQAGRIITITQSIETNGGNINLVANDTVANGVVDTQRDAGAATIAMGGNTQLHAGTGDIDLIVRAGNDKTNFATRDMSLHRLIGNAISIVNEGLTSGSGVMLTSGGAISASGSGDAIIIAGDRFTNNAGASALDATHASGRYVVWTDDPANDTVGGLSPDFIQYGATYGSSTVAAAAAESGLLYTYQPSVSPNFQAAITKTYDGSTAATVLDSDIGTAGQIGGDIIVLNAANSVFDTKNIGSGKTVSLSGLTIASASRGSIDLYGYNLTTTTASNANGQIDPKTISLTGETAANKTYDATTTATVTSYGSLSGVETGDTVSLDTNSATSVFASANVGTSIGVTISNLALTGTDAGNYIIADGSTTADITAKALSLSGLSISNKTYDANTTATISNLGSLTGVESGDTVSLNSGSANAAFADANVSIGKSVTVSNLSLAGADAANYSLSSPSSTADITAATLTISAPSASNKTYDANTNASVTAGSLSGLVNSETLSVSAAGTFSDANVGTGKSVSVAYTLADGTGTASNYTLADGSTTADITAATLTISAPSASNKTYDANTNASVTAGSLSGLVNSETLSVSAAGTFSDANVGTGKSVSVAYTLADGTGDANNYVLADGSTTADITAATLTISAPSASNKTYDANTNASVTAGSLSGLVNSETLSVSAAGTFSDANVGTGKSVSVAYTLADGTGTASNYTLADGSTTADITAATLTISAPSASNKTYDANTNASVTAGSLSGLVNSETLSVSAAGTFSDANVGTGKSVSVAYTLADGTGTASNYTLADGSTTADITAATLTISAPSASNKIYDANTTASVTAGSLSGLVNSETLSVSAAGTFSDANVGTGKSVSVAYTLADGTGTASNYTLADGSTTADITAATLTISAPSASNKIYDANTTASVTAGSLSGLVNSETLSVSAAGTFSDANVGTGKSVSVAYTLADGTGTASNYTLADGSTTADITAATLTISAPSANNKIYDGTNTATITAGSLSGLVNSETVTVFTSGTFSDANVGTGKSVSVAYALANGSNGGLAANYNLSGSSTTADITAKALTISSPTVADKQYDGTTNTTITTGTLTGLIGSETLGVSAIGSFSDASIGTGKLVTVAYTLSDGISDGIASNYTLANDSLAADITKRLLNFSNLAVSDRIYDGSTAANITSTGQLTGIISGETVQFDPTNFTATFANADANMNKQVTFTGGSLTGADSGNYSLAPLSATASITPKALSITGTSVADKIYDGGRTATITPGTLSGLIGTETLTLTATGLFDTATVGSGKPVSIAYNILDGAYGGKAQNYSLNGEVLTANIEGENKETAKILEMAETSVEEVKSDVTKVMLKLEETFIETLTEDLSSENDFVASMGEWHMLICQKESLVGNVCSSN